MKKIIFILFAIFFCFGCAKEDKNIIINIYENSDKEDVEVIEKQEESEKDTSVVDDVNNESQPIVDESLIIVLMKINQN